MMILQADAFHLPYANKSFHTVVTSPPYWGLRKYAGEQGEEPLGLERTPERHVERMVEVFQEVRRVLRDDGVVWLNYGDCYSAAGWESNRRNVVGQGSFDPAMRKSGKDPGNKAGSLMLMPHRLAIALQDDGWIIRNDVVWYKRNPMPESVAGWRWERRKTGEKSRRQDGAKQKTHPASYDNINGGSDVVEWEYGDDYVLKKSSWRHTRAHEYVFQLVKKMGYYCNQEAVREAPQSDTSDGRRGGDGGTILARRQVISGGIEANHMGVSPSGRNPRSVMDVPTAPYSGAHYATFPPNLIAPLIRASCPRRACPECGQAWAAVVERKRVSNPGHKWGSRGDDPHSNHASHQESELTQSNVTDYRPTCECGHDDYKPGKVLDIFGGSGTTGMVAKELLRDWVIMDISRPYLDEQAKVRTGTGTPINALDNLPMFGGAR